VVSSQVVMLGFRVSSFGFRVSWFGVRWGFEYTRSGSRCNAFQGGLVMSGFRVLISGYKFGVRFGFRGLGLLARDRVVVSSQMVGQVPHLVRSQRPWQHLRSRLI
jgi:hypothetical protein